MPFISSIICLQIARPSPVPPNRRVVDASACTNFSNNLLRASSFSPIPVSATSTRIVALSSPLATISAEIEIEPEGVNLTALDARLSTTCRNLPESLKNWPDNSGAMNVAISRFLSLACVSISSIAPSKVAAGDMGTASRVSLLASSFEKSRMSLMMVSNAWPDVAITSV